MPVYEYTCCTCGHHFDLLREMSQADDPAKCLKCGSAETKRELSRCFTKNPSMSGGSGCSSCGGGDCSHCHS